MTALLAAACAALLLTLTPGVAGAQGAPKRLSDWLLERPSDEAAYPLGLSWRVPEERAYQSLLKRDLIDALAGERAGGARRLADWITGLPVTGRVPVAIADARWLQANPARDPVLLSHHSVVLPQRPTSVVVITERGERCAVVHTPGRKALAYLSACGVIGADWAWIAQPDGRVQRFGVAAWNAEPQDEPAPGAWIWGPSRTGGWSEKTSDLLIQFLATQGPSDQNRGQVSDLTPFMTPSHSERGQVPDLTPFRVTASDWGDAGLMQTPTARMGRAGAFRFSYSHVQPYSRGNVFVQPFDWLETGFRYTNVSNRLYGRPELSGSQSYKDKSIDVKFRLWQETAYVPQVAVGLRDIAGTGLFSGEYVVANKRWNDLDFSLGLGWGYLGSRGDWKGVGTRKADVGQGGSFGVSTYFRGPAAFFGGVQYQTPWPALILKAEYEGNDYQKEPQANNQRQRTAWNFGLVYRAANWVDVSLGVERGNTVMLGITLHTDLDRMQVPKVSDPPRIPLVAGRPQSAPDWAATSAEITRQTSWHVERIAQRGREVQVTLADATAGYWRDRIDRAAAVLNRDAPASVDRFVFTYRDRGVTVSEHVVDRDAWVTQYAQPLPPHARREIVVARPPAGETGETSYLRPQPRFEAGFGLDFQYSLGGPDAFLLYQLSAVERVKFRFRDDTWLTGRLRLGLINNYDRYKYTAPSNLPRVRTFLREFQTTSTLTMPQLQVTHVGKLADNQYYSVYAGYLEDMFGGVGAEWLYRPYASRSAFGVDLNAVKQREFEQAFGFRDYSVLTGHATWYWDTGWNDVQSKLSFGRYLAKDVGVTLEMSRTFKNGVTLGAFMTKTNVSAAQFGEGSFDKGVYLGIPFDAMLTRSTGSTGYFVWKPLTRDGGARLSRSEMLYDVTRTRDDRTLWVEAAPKPNEQSIPADRRENWTPAPNLPSPYVQVPPRTRAGQWTADGRFEHALVQALYAQQFRNVDVTYDAGQRLNISLAYSDPRSASVAAGRAARTALRLAPLDAREIRLALYRGAAPVVSYDFIDLPRLDRFLNGEVGPQELKDTVAVEWHDPELREVDAISGLRDLTTIAAAPKLTDLLPEGRTTRRVADDFVAAGKVAANADWLYGGAVAAGAVLASAVLDKRAFRFAADHAASRWMKAGVKVGDALPWIGMGAAAMAALDASDPRRSRTGYAAVEAGAAAFIAATGIKYAVGRARPDSGLSNGTFDAFSTDTRYQAFPSRHAAVAWAVATPFALEYKADWIYGVAALTTLARVGSREHWVSDAVAGSLLGFAAGRIFHQASQSNGKGAPRLLWNGRGVSLAWALE